MLFKNAKRIKDFLIDRKLFTYKQFLRYKHELPLIDTTVVPLSSLRKKIKTWTGTVEDGYTCFITNCTFCHKKLINQPKLYVNKISGFYTCGCGKYAGNWDVLEKFMETKTTTTSSKQISILKQCALQESTTLQQWESICKETKDVNGLLESDWTEITEHLQIINLQKTTLQHLQSRFNLAKKHIYFPLFNGSSQIVGYKKLKLKTKDEITVPGTECSGIAIWRSSSKPTIALLITKIVDILYLARHRIPYDIICLPHSTTVLPQQLLPALERYEKIIIWFNNDMHSLDAAKHFAKKLNEQRCFIVRPNDKFTTPSSIANLSELKQVINSAPPVWHRSITTFTSLRDDVLFDLKNIEKIEGVKWARYPTLNRILKGHRRGELTILTGPTGSGKTTFISEYSLDLALQGVNTLWGSFEIRNSRLARTMLQQLAEIPLEENLDQFDYWADQFEQLPIYFMTFHGQQSIKIVMEAVEHATYVHDIAHVVIDNVQFMMGISEDARHMDRFWKQDLIVASFRTFATRKNCHVTLVIHPRKERETEDLTTSSIFGGAKASQEADNVLLIQDKRLTSIRGKKYLQVAKNRYSGDLGIIPLDFDKSGLSYRQKKKKIDERKIKSTSETENPIIDI